VRLRLGALAAVGALLGAGCSSVSSRIQEHRALFDASPREVQDAVRAGRVEAGFTPEQVYMAFGRPDRVMQPKTAGGEGETWLYGASGGSSAGLGFGPGGPGYGTELIAADASAGDARLRVAFLNGRVVSVETRR